MQVAIRLGWKAGNNLGHTASFEVSINYMLDKVNRFIGVSHRSKSGRLSKGEIIAAATSAINKKPV
jgi:hypothetical protein